MKKKSTLFIFILTFSIFSLARLKIDGTVGFFSLKAKNTETEGSKTGLGVYSLMLRKDFFGQYEYTFGYTILISNAISGDLGYGPDLGLTFFPFSSSAPNVAESTNIKFISNEFLKPYVFMEFSQRQYQSVSSSYAGFSFGAGLEIAWIDQFSYSTKIRMSNLTGPSRSTSNEVDLLAGILYWY